MLWRRLDQPGHESCRLSSRRSSWQLAGTAVFAHERRPCRLDYLVVCDSAWQTVSGRVAGWVGTEVVEIALAVRAAWLLFPSFRLEPLEQRYRRVAAPTYRYESGDGTFATDLEVNEAGFVTRYPGSWEAEAVG